jgi:hypothetical protein
MNDQRMMWNTCVAAAVSAVVSVATLCFIAPLIVGEQTKSEHSPMEPAMSATGFAQTDPPSVAMQPATSDQEQDREAIETIKQKLGINVFSGTLLDDELAEDSLDQKDRTAAAQTPEQIATQALTSTAEQLQADGQTAAAQLVQAAAAKLQQATARAAADRSKRTR